MVARLDIQQFLDQTLQPLSFKDYCPNGLQVEGQSEIRTCVVGVTASQALINQAVVNSADMLLVHHGLFWRGDAYPVTGIKRARLAALLASDINLFAYHLPLDCHRTLGNNAQIGQRLELEDITSCEVDGCRDLLWEGKLTQPVDTQAFQQQLTDCFQRAPLFVGLQSDEIRRVAWCSGGAQKYIVEAHQLGVDVYISGEISEQTTHLARELSVGYFSCGHHATECFGVQALGQALAQAFDIEVMWVDDPNPI